MSDIKTSSIKSLYSEMLAALKSNDDEFNWLISMCSNQSKLSQLERKSVGIVAMTLNTFKNYADRTIQGGFNEVNRIRKELNKKLHKNKAPNKKQSVKEKLINYKVKLDEAERARALLIRAYNDLNLICLDTISRSPEYQYDYKRHIELYSSYFGLGLATKDE